MRSLDAAHGTAVTYNHMVVDQLRRDQLRTDQLRTDRLFHALAAATRRDIVTQTLDRERSVSDLARLYPMSFAAVQKHVAVLEHAQLVTKRRRGRERMVRGNATAVHDASRVLRQLEAVWRSRIDRLGEILAGEHRAGESEAGAYKAEATEAEQHEEGSTP